MARLPRLAVGGEAHLVVLRGHSGSAVFADTADRAEFLAVLQDAGRQHDVHLHAYALHPAEALLLLRPATAAGLSAAMQALGRRYVSAYNRRHQRSGTLWEGRFRCGVVEPGAWTLAALLLLDGGGDASSAAHRAGGTRDPAIVDPREFWALGNTPFEREAAYGRLLALGVSTEQRERLRHAALGGWVAGSPSFQRRTEQSAERRVRPARAGRPRTKPRQDGIAAVRRSVPNL